MTGALAAPSVAATNDLSTPPNATTATTTAEDDGRNVSVQVDSNTYVANYEYVDGEFRVTMVTTAPVTRVTLSEAIGGDKGGTGYFSVRQVTLRNGEPTTVTVPAEQVDGKAVITLTTSACINSGKCPYLQAGSGSGTFFNGSATWGIVYTAGGVSMVGVAFGTRRYMMKQRVDDDERRIEEVFA